MSDMEVVPITGGVRENIRKHSSVITAVHLRGVDLHPADVSFFNYLVARVYPYPRPGIVYQISLKEAMEFMQFDRVSKIHESLSRLGQVMIEIDYTDKFGESNTIRTHYLSSESSHADSGILKFAFDPILVHFLSDPKVYGQISVNRSLDLKTMAAKRLYEFMCLQRSKRSPIWHVSVDEFREIVSMQEKHPRFDNFRRNIIEKAVQEVNAVADFDVLFDVETSGQGGTASTLMFKVVGKSHARLLQSRIVKNTKARGKSGDQFTVDMLDGKTNFERGGPAELTADMIDKVAATLNDEEDIEDFVRDWREETRGLSLIDPDAHFHNWVEMRKIKVSDPLLNTLDDDVFANFLAEDL